MTRLEQLFAEERHYFPAEARYKNQSLSQKILGFYAQLFNPRYMQSFITTIYPHTYFPSKSWVERDIETAARIEAHEFVHKYDRWGDRLWGFKYLLPQILMLPVLAVILGLGGVPGLIGFGIFMVLSHLGLLLLNICAWKNWSSRGITAVALSLMGLGALTWMVLTFDSWAIWGWPLVLMVSNPWIFESTHRRDAEIRGYTMSLYVQHLGGNAPADSTLEDMAVSICGAPYFWAGSDVEIVKNELKFQTIRFQTNEQEFLLQWKWGFLRGPSASAYPYNVAKKLWG